MAHGHVTRRYDCWLQPLGGLEFQLIAFQFVIDDTPIVNQGHACAEAASNLNSFRKIRMI